MDNLRSSRFSNLSTVLWVLASVAAFGAFLLLAPSLLNPTTAGGTPLATLRTARATLTPVITSTPIPLPPTPHAVNLTPPPVLPSDAQLFSFIADPTRSGYIVSGEDKPHWGDRNLHAGFFKGQTYRSVLLFDLAAIPPGSQILFADLELTGLSRDNLGASGAWSVQVLAPSVLTNWTARTASELANAETSGTVGAPLDGSALDARLVNQFVFANESPQLEEAINSTALLALRLDGPNSGANSLFTWDSGGLDLKNQFHPTLRIAAIPGRFTVITNTPTPANVLTEAARGLAATALAARIGTPTSFPRNIATATPVIYVTAQPTPANLETRVALAAYATAVAQTTGTYTPTPSNWIVVTPAPPTWTQAPTATPLAIPFSTLVGTLTPNATATRPLSAAQIVQTPVPDFLRGNIIFLTDRFGDKMPVPLVMQPDGTLLQGLTGTRFYSIAFTREPYSPDLNQLAIVQLDPNGVLQIWTLETSSGIQTQITRYTKGITYDPVWSPDGTRLAYVSRETGADNIYIYDFGLRSARQITFNSDPFVYEQRPSWSPDSTQLVFKSNRETGHFQIWIMNADGSGARILSPSTANDTDPIWVK